MNEKEKDELKKRNYCIVDRLVVELHEMIDWTISIFVYII